jgi:hypothetical protein
MLQNGDWRSVAVQFVSEPEICHGAGFILRAGARVRVQVLIGFVLRVGSRKNHDEPINYTVRVIGWFYFSICFFISEMNSFA